MTRPTEEQIEAGANELALQWHGLPLFRLDYERRKKCTQAARYVLNSAGLAYVPQQAALSVPVEGEVGEQITWLLDTGTSQVCSQWRREKIAALLRTLSVRPVGVPDGWRGIESAPKDGTCVLVADSNAGGSWVEAAYWSTEEGHEGWYMRGTDWTDYVDGQVWPAWWKPMPAAPQREEG